MKTYKPFSKYLVVTILGSFIAIPIYALAEDTEKKACFQAYGRFFSAQILKEDNVEIDMNCALPLGLDRFFGVKKATTSVPESKNEVATSTPKILKRKLAPIYVRPRHIFS